MGQYLLQKPGEGRFAECLKQKPDRDEIDARDLWVGFEVDVIAIEIKQTYDYLDHQPNLSDQQQDENRSELIFRDFMVKPRLNAKSIPASCSGAQW